MLGTRFTFAEAIAGYHRTQLLRLAGRTLLGLAVVATTQNADTFLAGGILELAANWIADIVLHTRTQVALHTLDAIPVKLITAFALGTGTGTRNPVTYIALGGLMFFLANFLLHSSCKNTTDENYKLKTNSS